MGSIGSVTKSDTHCYFFSDPIIVQLEELENQIWNILSTEAVAQAKDNISAVQENHGKGVNNNQLIRILVVSEELKSKAIDKNSQLCKNHAENSFSRQLFNNNICYSTGGLKFSSSLIPYWPKQPRWLKEKNMTNSMSATEDL